MPRFITALVTRVATVTLFALPLAALPLTLPQLFDGSAAVYAKGGNGGGGGGGNGGGKGGGQGGGHGADHGGGHGGDKGGHGYGHEQGEADDDDSGGNAKAGKGFGRVNAAHASERAAPHSAVGQMAQYKAMVEATEADIEAQAAAALEQLNRASNKQVSSTLMQQVNQLLEIETSPVTDEMERQLDAIGEETPAS